MDKILIYKLRSVLFIPLSNFSLDFNGKLHIASPKVIQTGVIDGVHFLQNEESI